MSISRRKVIALSGSLAVAAAFPALGEEARPYSDISETDDWIRAWMKSMRAVSGPLHLGRFADPMYYLLEQVNWDPNPGQRLSSTSVPVGFVTDFASVPRAFWAILPRDGAYTYPAILHDYLYWEQPCPREEADLVLRYAMEDFKVGRPAIETIHRGVRVGGGFAWRDNAKRKSKGEKRILAEMPTDPTTTWDEWRKRDVFKA